MVARSTFSPARQVFSTTAEDLFEVDHETLAEVGEQPRVLRLELQGPLDVIEFFGDLARRGITVNAVAPGLIETRLTAAMPALLREGARRLSALGQGGTPGDVAELITFLATPGAAGLSGQTLRVCGGAMIGA